MSSTDSMTFARYGRSYHLKIETAEDLDRVLELNKAHWVATGAPVDTLNCDPVLLAHVDSDANGRILCYEMTDAIHWLRDVLRDRRGVTDRRTSLRLGDVNTHSEDGRRIHVSATKILTQSGNARAEEITLEQVREVKRKVEDTPVSEAGVVLPEATEDPEIRAFLADIVATVGGAPHPSGTEGVGREQLDKFLKEAEVYLAWHARGDVPKGKTKTGIMPLGDETVAAFEVFAALRDKVEQYFSQSRAVALDARLAAHVVPSEEKLSALDFSDVQVVETVLKDAPLSTPRPERTLPLDEKGNPYYTEALASFRTRVAAPVLGRDAAGLTETDWEKLKAAFAAHRAWVDEKPDVAVETLGVERLRACLDQKYRTAVEALIAESANTAFVLDNIRLTEKLILYQATMIALANNFVSFPDLYDEQERAMFETGSLVCDGRRFNMAVKVAGRAEHAAVAKTSNMYVIYAEITSRTGDRKLEVALPVTSGGKGNLCVGKRGLFIDVDGVEWDAKIVQIIENPISLGEALASPFQRIGRAVTGKIESMTTETEKKLDTAATAAVAQAPPAAGPAKGGTGMMAGGLLMGGGVALAALGSAAAYISKTLAGVALWKILIAIAAAVLAVILPISVVAIFKLRRRDLSAILEGSGWAVNARMRLTRRQCRFFTQRPKFPEGAKGIRRRWWMLVVAAAVIAGIIALGAVFAKRTAGPASAPTTTTPTTR